VYFSNAPSRFLTVRSTGDYTFTAVKRTTYDF
jgi:hypothetical protein